MDLKYKKRPGTSGIAGQLYETKLISLILFRLLHDDAIEDFYLGSNLNDIGAFDDICFKIKIAGRDRPVAVFVQVKHKDNDDKSLSLDNKNDAVKWSDSVFQIKKKIACSKSVDKIFSADFDKTDYIFILYTNAKCDFVSKNIFESEYAAILNNLMATNDKVGLQSSYAKEKELGENILEAHISALAEQFANFLSHEDNQSMKILNDEYINRYHVILRENVVDVSDIQTDEQNPDSKWRIMTFRPDFFVTVDKYLMLFRMQLYEQMSKKQTILKTSDTETMQDSTTTNPDIEKLFSAFFANPSAVTLSALIVTHITCDANGKLVFATERSEHDIKRLEEINNNNMSLSTINEAKAIAKLLKFKIKVPSAFGNIDLAISGSPKKIDRRLNYLMKAIVNICQNYTETDSYKLVTINDTIDAGILSSNGGLASGVGNILVYDKNTKFLRFASDDASLKSNAKALFSKLKDKIKKMHTYRFDVKTMKFPKLSLDCTDIAREFLSKLVIYANQRKHNEIDNILQKEIQHHTSTKLNKFSSKFDLILIYFHDEIQKWWMSPETGSYLTKTSNIYEQTINNIEAEPQICKFRNMFHMNNLRYLGYSFSENVMNSFKSLKQLSKMAIVTNITKLTVLKVIKCLENLLLQYVVLYLDTILNLSKSEFSALDAELKKTKNVVIIVCDNTEYNVSAHVKLTGLAMATKEKQAIIITNDVFIEAVEINFECADHVLYDKTQSLADMTPETQRDVIDNSKIMFQGFEVGLDLFVDDTSVTLIKGIVLNKIIRNETISIGLPLSNSYYDEIKHLYVDRRVSQVSYDTCDTSSGGNPNSIYKLVNLNHLVRTFYDISDDAVLITAAAGMGKSTLLTHLALETKRHDKTIWIIRINLLDYSKEFYKWQENDTVFNTLETLKFMCRVILKNDNLSINLKETNKEVFLEGCTGDEWATFELQMFLHFYNKRRLIILFDGFDEICPHYKNSVIKFLNVVRNYPQQNKMWVTSRPYSDILPDLRSVLGKYFKIENLSDAEQETYLQNTWRANLRIDKLNEVQLKNLLSFVDFIPQLFTGMNCTPSHLEMDFYRIYAYFYVYALSHLPDNIRTTVAQLPIYTDLFDVSYSEPDTTKTADKLVPRYYRQCSLSKDPDALLGTPLLLYFIADYFVNIVDTYQDTSKWQLDMNVFKIYEMFINNKLKKILFQDKNKMDVYNPDIIMKYKKEHADCITMHKKLAAYDLFESPIFRKLKCEEFKEIDILSKEEFDDLIYKIKTGEEKTGLISHVNTHDVPVFIHKTFTEYFVAEFLCDMFKSNKFRFDSKQLLYTIIYLFGTRELLPWIAGKCKIDNNLADIIRQIQNKRPLYLTWYRQLFYDWRGSDMMSHEQFIRLMNSSEEDYETGCFDKYSENCVASEDPYDDLPASYNFCDEVKIHLVSKMKPHLKKHFESKINKQQRMPSLLTEDIWFRYTNEVGAVNK